MTRLQILTSIKDKGLRKGHIAKQLKVNASTLSRALNKKPKTKRSIQILILIEEFLTKKQS